MPKVDPQSERASRIGRIQAIVQEDYERIQDNDDPFVILNLTATASAEEVRDRYERYERFYRADNFQRLGDMDLTRKALDIRRAIGRAMVEIQTQIDSDAEEERSMPAPDSVPELPAVDPDAAAMGDIYFRDGLTLLRLGDFNAARDYLQRSCSYDPSRGIILANLAYTRFKLDPTDIEVVKSTGRNLNRAVTMEPDNPEILVLMARFGINSSDICMAHRAIKQLETIRPEHPRLDRLKKRAKY